jgi:hypothetical protein
MTSPAKAASVVPVTTASLKVGLAATAIGAAETKLGIAIGTAVVATALTVGGITATRNDTPSVSRHLNTNVSDNQVGDSGGFQYPSELLDAYDPDGNGWEGIKDNEIFATPIALQKWLVGPPHLERSSVVLPPGHWVKLKFPGEIIDGPGYDIFIVEWGERGEKARVFITDGNDNEYLLGTMKIGVSGLQVPTETGFDISGISLPFVPCAVRIVGIKGGGGTVGFDLHSIRARVSTSHDNR